MKFLVILLLLEVYQFGQSDSQKLLDKRLSYYEPLMYNRNDLHTRHLQITQSDDILHVHFQAFNKNFTLELKRESFSQSYITLHHKRKSTTADLSFIYTGKQTDYPDSRARVALINGTLQGQVVLPGDTTYHIVPGTWLFGKSPPFHTVIYSEKDYVWNHTYGPEEQWQQKISHTSGQRKGRLKRELPRSPGEQLQKRNICTLKLTADHTLWRYFMSRNQNEDRSRYDILYLMDSHVAEANQIFGQTEFTLNKGKFNEKKISGIQFAIKRIRIMTEADCDDVDSDHPSVCSEALDGKSLLHMFTDMQEFGTTDYTFDYEDYSSYYDQGGEEEAECLSFLFTARVLHYAVGTPPKPFPMLGLAFPATPDKKLAGGICGPAANTGFVTLLQGTDKVQVLSTHVTQLIFTHELAHSFGAVHDDQKECSDYQLREEPEDGYYLMHSIAQRGDKPNHTKFSKCSLDFISKTLTYTEYTHCFTDDKKLPFCGNGIMDPGEECDCGEDCRLDHCCHPHNSSNGLRCTLKPGAQCSVSQGPCCHSVKCQFINQSEQFPCQNEQPCMAQLLCHGEAYGAKCPPPKPHQVKPDGFICSHNGRACHAGSCNASVCKLIHWRECQVFTDKQKLTISEKEDLCYIGCQKSSKSECISTNDLRRVHLYPELEDLLRNVSEQEKTNKLPIQLPIGTPCNKNRGYCDVFQRCRGADPDTPLARLGNCLASGECAVKIIAFVKVYWWAVLIGSLIGITFFYLFVKCCAVHTKSSNPVYEIKHPHRSMRQSVTSVRETIAHPRRSFRSSVTGIRSSFRKKSARYSREVSQMSKVIPEIAALNPEQEKELNDVFV